MDFVKKLGLIVATNLAIIFAAYGATPTHAAPFEVNVPDLQSGFEVTLEGFYEKVSNGDLDYAKVTTILNPVVNNTDYDLKTIRPTYDFGFHVDVGYIFPDSGNDISLGYSYLTTDANDGVRKGEIGFSIVSPINSPSSFQEASAHSEFKYHMVDLNVGQFVDVGTRLQVHFSGGIRYVDLEHDFDKTFLSPAAAVPLTVDDKTKFEGIGPEFGIQTDYHVTGCFGIVGRVYTGLLIGDMDTRTDVKQVGGSVLNEGVLKVFVDRQSTVRLLPYLDTKLGINYSIPFYLGKEFTAELGWQFTHYFNINERLNLFFGPLTLTVNDIVQGVERNVSGVGFNGPYFSLHLKL